MIVKELINYLMSPDLECGSINKEQVLNRKVVLCTSPYDNLEVLSVYMVDKDTVCIDLG